MAVWHLGRPQGSHVTSASAPQGAFLPGRTQECRGAASRRCCFQSQMKPQKLGGKVRWSLTRQ